jgi:hypothetical protein
MISSGLNRLTQDWPVITEEDWDESRDNITSESYWCVDPLDGTKGFLNGGKDFTVNIALIHGDYPVLGVIFAPARQTLWATDGDQVWRRDFSNDAQSVSDTPPIPYSDPALPYSPPYCHYHHGQIQPDFDSLAQAILHQQKPFPSDHRLSFVIWQKAKPIFIRASAQPWNGIPPQGKLSLRRQAAND